MKDRYDGAPGKDAAMARTRHARFEAEHNSNHAFMKKVQGAQARYAGRAPKLQAESLEFSSYMCNNGEHAQEFARDLTRGLDKSAFPVK